MNRNYKFKLWKERIRQYLISGLTQGEFCRRFNINYNNFRYWYQKTEIHEEIEKETDVLISGEMELLSPEQIKKVYLLHEYIDMRISVNGLAAIVQYGLSLDPFATDTIYVFCNRSKDRIKILQWNGNGFILHYKRLERDKFKWPRRSRSPILISYQRLQRMIEGSSIYSRE